MQIRPCGGEDFDAIHAIINDAAQAYADVLPADLWKEPYMSRAELRHEIVDGVAFWGCEARGVLVGVMGLQEVDDVTLVRHAYVRTKMRNQGIGGALIRHLRATASRPMLVGTWAAAEWAIRFYERYGFRLVSPEEKDQLLRRYWSVPGRQIETSVVLVDERWLADARAWSRSQ
jgi:N-acetylglutamate synthase-like GNAT family acetyltransferase